MSRGLGLWLKRLMDIAGSLMLILLFSPIFLVVTALVWFNFGGPVIYRSPRIGAKAQIFQTYKFRSMLDLRDASGKPLPDEQRLTRFSKLLRATSFDELPQFFNILKGDMSMIGPRPMLADFLPFITPEEMRRFDMLPGISGWAQVNGRNALQWDERLKYDVWYVDHWSLWLDLKIGLRTLPIWARAQGINMPGFATCVRLDDYRRHMHQSLNLAKAEPVNVEAQARAVGEN